MYISVAAATRWYFSHIPGVTNLAPRSIIYAEDRGDRGYPALFQATCKITPLLGPLH